MRKVLIYIGILAALILMVCVSIRKCQDIQDKLDIATANIKAYDMQLSDEKGKNTAYQFTIDQLNYFQDSILTELNATRKELKIKDSKLKSLQYISSSFSKTDTVVIEDTIFKDTAFSLDTIIGDDWYSVNLGLKYPSTIAVTPEFKSVKHVVISTKKETVNPPKKFFLFRWFQRKHQVIQVDVVEKNPYSGDSESRYIEIIK